MSRVVRSPGAHRSVSWSTTLSTAISTKVAFRHIPPGLQSGLRESHRALGDLSGPVPPAAADRLLLKVLSPRRSRTPGLNDCVLKECKTGTGEFFLFWAARARQLPRRTASAGTWRAARRLRAPRPPLAPARTVPGSWGKTTRDVGRNTKRWNRRRTPTQYPSTGGRGAHLVPAG